MKICVVGTGYVGLVTGTCFAETGNTVVCVDVDEQKINCLNAGVIPIYEPGLKELVDKNVREGRLSFVSGLQPGLEGALFCFITVGTPPGDDGAADISQVLAAARGIGRYMQQYLIVINKSTAPVGTADKVREAIRRILAERNADIEFDVVSNPEFLKEGKAVEDFMRPDRVVIGTDNVRAAELMKKLYEPFVRNQNPLLVMDIKSAEITKYAANVMLAARISFINEIAGLCDRVGGDIANVRKGVGTDSRIGMQFLYAGLGYGGSCFPKDVKELISAGRRNGLEMSIAAAVDKVNERQKLYLIDMIRKRYGDDLTCKKFAVWGLAFKPQTDDMRDAPSLSVIQALIKLGAVVAVYDPQAMEQARRIFSEFAEHIQYAGSMLEAVNGVDALVLVTEWQQFRQPDFEEIKRRMLQPVVFDGRNQYDPVFMKSRGFEYYCIGRNCYVG